MYKMLELVRAQRVTIGGIVCGRCYDMDGGCLIMHAGLSRQQASRHAATMVVWSYAHQSCCRLAVGGTRTAQ